MYAVDQMVPGATGTAVEVAMVAASPLPADDDGGAAEEGAIVAEVDARGDSCAFAVGAARQRARRKADIAGLLDGCWRVAFRGCSRAAWREATIEDSD